MQGTEVTVNLSQMMQHVYRNLGKVAAGDEFLATSGSTTAIIEDTTLATREEPPPPDDNYGYGFTAFVVRDALGTSVAPENEFSKVTAYNSATYQWTISPVVSTAIGTGDKIMLANGDIPYQTMMELANMMLKDLGRIELVDATSLTTASTTTEHDYTLPVAAKFSLRRVQVEQQLGDSYDIVYERRITPAAPGSTGLLTLPAMTSGLVIKLWYEGIHPTLTAYNSTISETIDENLAILGLQAYALQWYNRTSGGNSTYWLDEEQNVWRAFEAKKKELPVVKSSKVPRWFAISETVVNKYEVE